MNRRAPELELRHFYDRSAALVESHFSSNGYCCCVTSYMIVGRICFQGMHIVKFFRVRHKDITLLPKDLRFEHGRVKLASCPRRHLTSLRLWLDRSLCLIKVYGHIQMHNSWRKLVMSCERLSVTNPQSLGIPQCTRSKRCLGMEGYDWPTSWYWCKWQRMAPTATVLYHRTVNHEEYFLPSNTEICTNMHLVQTFVGATHWFLHTCSWIVPISVGFSCQRRRSVDRSALSPTRVWKNR